MKRTLRVLLALLLLLQAACATQGKTIAAGMVGGAVVGAVVGHQFVHHGPNKRYEKENTAITAVLFALLTGGVLAWHYREMNQQQVEISGRYARFRLCDPQDMNLARQLEQGTPDKTLDYRLQPEQIGKSAISLDDNTKWVYPTFRKRFLEPERGENQVISSRYIWEIVRPGNFVTRSQNPSYFFEGGGAK